MRAIDSEAGIPMADWAHDAIFYHIYPLGFCGAPRQNDFSAPPVPRLDKVLGWLDHMRTLRVNALYLGPVFESTAHGYDTADYRVVDRRLGSKDTLAGVVAACHERGIRVILDGVFNHVGRDFWAFRDVRERGESSPYCGWFQGLRFDRRSPCGDPFTYEGWRGHYDLVKLDLGNAAVRAHLFQAVAGWVADFDIDGLRLDAADCVDLGFWKEFAAVCRRLRPDFWLLGEIIHGDYARWANPETLDSVTNYETHKGLFSSLNDKNFFEIAFALKRQFSPEDGLYKDLPLYNFADNHDVTRVAARLANRAHLFPLYALLFTMPGVPSVYYGSEWGVAAKKDEGGDADYPLRPCLDLDALRRNPAETGLVDWISRLAEIRERSPALRRGLYRELLVKHEQLVFARQSAEECVVVALNATARPVTLEVDSPVAGRGLVDWLNRRGTFPMRGRRIRLEDVPACGARIAAVLPATG